MIWNPFKLYREWKYKRETRKAFNLICDQITEWLRAGYSVDEVMMGIKVRTGSKQSDAEVRQIIKNVVVATNDCIIARDKRKRMERERKK